MQNKTSLLSFQAAIDYSLKNYFQLPWRVDRHPWKTLVSEVMLQQTTVATVEKHFTTFIAKYPTPEGLASASIDQLLADWKGLGYYRRIKNLHKSAQYLVQHHHAQVPQDLNVLLQIPGIGPYTAHALIGIGFDRPALAIDANISRVLGRFFHLDGQQKHLMKKFEAGDFDYIFSALSSRSFHEAIMDVGRIFCKARQAHCELCPLKLGCQSFLSNAISFNNVKKNQVYNLSLARIIYMDSKSNRIAVYQKRENEWLGQQWELPTFVEYSEDLQLSQYPSLEKILAKQQRKLYFKGPLFEIKSTITKYRIVNHVYVLNSEDFCFDFYLKDEQSLHHLWGQSWQWVDVKTLMSKDFSLGHTCFKILNKYIDFKNMQKYSKNSHKKCQVENKPDSVNGHHSSRV